MEADRRGFTVMEIFIVIVVLCILAAIVVPRISQASAEGKLSDMVSRLQMVRSQIQLYKVQHGDLLPGQEFIAGDITEARFITAMTKKNAVDGYGPYFKKMPKNPFISGLATDNITCVNDTNTIPTGTESTGWWLNAATGQFRACDSKFHTAY